MPPTQHEVDEAEAKGLLQENSGADWVPVSAGDGYNWMQWMMACGGASLFVLLALVFVSESGKHPGPSPFPKVPPPSAPSAPVIMPQLARAAELKFGEQLGEIGDDTWEGPRRPSDGSCASGWVRAPRNGSYCVGDGEEESLNQIIHDLAGDGGASWQATDWSTGCTKYGAPVWFCQDGTTRTMLVGPFSSQVQSWHAVMMKIASPSYEKSGWALLEDGDRIVQFRGDTVMAEDTSRPVPYPPLHMHHIHVVREIPHWFETHGDFNMDPTLGYVSLIPKDSCVQHDGSTVQVQAQVNDVRFAAGTSMVAKKHKDAAAANAAADELVELRKDHGSYNWFLRIRFELAAAHEHCTVVSKFILMYPPDLMSTQDLLNRYNVGNSSKAYSWTVEMDVPGGTFHPPAWMHSHRARHAGYVLLRGEHTLHSLVSAECILGRNGCNTVAGIRKALLETDEEILCADNYLVDTDSIYIPDKHMGDGMTGNYDRQGNVKCKSFNFDRGDMMTVLSFAIPRWADEMGVFPQHSMLFALYVPFKAQPSLAAQLPPHRWSIWEPPTAGSAAKSGNLLSDANLVECRRSQEDSEDILGANVGAGIDRRLLQGRKPECRRVVTHS